MKFRIAATIGAMAALALSASAALAQETLKWAHVYETSEPFHTESVWAGEEIAKRTNGRYKIEVYPGLAARQGGRHQPGPDARHRRHHHFRLQLRGQGTVRAMGVTYYPFTFRDADHLIAYTKSDNYKELAEAYEEKTGHHITATSYYGTRQTTSNRPIAKCADMEGLKMRVPDVPAYLAMPRACGANTAPIAFAEVYLALQNGTVEAQENPLTTIEAKKFYEVQKNIVLTGHIVDHLNTIIVADAAGPSLSDEDKADPHRSPAGSRQAHLRQDRGEREGPRPGVQGPGPDGDRGRQGRLSRRRWPKKVTFEEFGYDKADSATRIQAVHSKFLPSVLRSASSFGTTTPSRAASAGSRAQGISPASGEAAMSPDKEHHTQVTAEEIAHAFEEEAAPRRPVPSRLRGLDHARRVLGHGGLRLPAVLHRATR